MFAVALALEGNTLYAAGSSFVEALDASTGASRWQTAVDGYVSALAANGHALYVGGDFKKIADTTHPTLAALDLASGHLLAWQAPPIDNDGHTGSVAGLGLTDSRLFIGGVFTSVDGQPRPNAVAALDAKTGDVTPWRSGSVGDVETMLVAHGQVLTSGYDGWGVTNARTGKMEPWMNQVGAHRFAALTLSRIRRGYPQQHRRGGRDAAEQPGCDRPCHQHIHELGATSPATSRSTRSPPPKRKCSSPVTSPSRSANHIQTGSSAG